MTTWYLLLQEKENTFEHSHMLTVEYKGEKYIRFSCYGKALFETALSVARVNNALLLEITCDDEYAFDHKFADSSKEIPLEV